MGSMPGETAPMNMGNSSSKHGNSSGKHGSYAGNARQYGAGQNNMAFCEDLDRFPIGMGYVPMQRWSQPSPLDEAFAGNIHRAGSAIVCDGEVPMNETARTLMQRIYEASFAGRYRPVPEYAPG